MLKVLERQKVRGARAMPASRSPPHAPAHLQGRKAAASVERRAPPDAKKGRSRERALTTKSRAGADLLEGAQWRARDTLDSSPSPSRTRAGTHAAGTQSRQAQTPPAPQSGGCTRPHPSAPAGARRRAERQRTGPRLAVAAARAAAARPAREQGRCAREQAVPQPEGEPPGAGGRRPSVRVHGDARRHLRLGRGARCVQRRRARRRWLAKLRQPLPERHAQRLVPQEREQGGVWRAREAPRRGLRQALHGGARGDPSRVARGARRHAHADAASAEHVGVEFLGFLRRCGALAGALFPLLHRSCRKFWTRGDGRFAPARCGSSRSRRRCRVSRQPARLARGRGRVAVARLAAT